MKKVFVLQLRLVTLLTVGLCSLAHAQTPDFSLPPLPPVPGMGTSDLASTGATAPAIPMPPTAINNAVPTSPALPSLPTSSIETNTPAAKIQPDAIPELANLPVPERDAAVKTALEGTQTPPAEAATKEKSALPLANEAADAAGNPGGQDGAAPVAANNPVTPPVTSSTVELNVAAPPTTLPGLDLPVPGAEPMKKTAAPVNAATVTTTTAPAATLLPDIDVPASAPATRSWMTKLAPAVIPPKGNFNYKRQVLPGAVYRTAYDRDNQHLPAAVTRDDYVRLLYARVAANDVDATRALLNSGLEANKNHALAVARQYGAHDTERLLLARGAS